MHIVLFYQYHHNPDCAATGRYYTFMKRWARRHSVTLVTTDAWVSKRITHRYPWVPPGVHLVELHVPYDNAMSPARRMRAFLRYAVKAVGHGLLIPTPDVIVGTSTPLTAAWAAAQAARLRRVPWVFEVRDLWPDFPIQMGSVPSSWMRHLLYRMEHSLYRSAAHVVALSPDMASHIRRFRRDGGVTTLLNGTDLDLIQHGSENEVDHLRTVHDLQGKQVVLYAGSLGRANNIPLLLDAASRLQHRADLQFVVLGYGYMQEAAQAAARQLRNLTVLPPQPRHAMGAWYRLAALTLVPFLDLPVLATNAPSKLFDSLGAGTPVLVTNPGWTKTLVETHACGWYAPASDAEAIAGCIDRVTQTQNQLREAGERGRSLAHDAFDRQILAERLEQILVDAAGRARQGKLGSLEAGELGKLGA